MSVSEKTIFLISDLFKDKSTQVVTLSITILAVCAAISGLKASSYSTKVALYSSLENKGWSFYQSKSVLSNIFPNRKEISITITSPSSLLQKNPKYLESRSRF
ncbi:MAG: DUF4337 family protein [Candidatus Margulisbacteria bacterium]|nr:DUF4337 family protein [Candidatus Margulisiibacteriota bacterium]